jgi:hypothetical protein
MRVADRPAPVPPGDRRAGNSAIGAGSLGLNVNAINSCHRPASVSLRI